MNLSYIFGDKALISVKDLRSASAAAYGAMAAVTVLGVKFSGEEFCAVAASFRASGDRKASNLTKIGFIVLRFVR